MGCRSVISTISNECEWSHEEYLPCKMWLVIHTSCMAFQVLKPPDISHACVVRSKLESFVGIESLIVTTDGVVATCPRE